MKAERPEPLSPSDQVVALADRRKPVSPLRERRRVLPRRALRTPVHQAQPPQEPIEQLGDLEDLVEHRPVRLTARQHHLLTTERHPATAASQADGHPGRERLLAGAKSHNGGHQRRARWGQKTIATAIPVGRSPPSRCPPDPATAANAAAASPPPAAVRAHAAPRPQSEHRRDCGGRARASGERRAPRDCDEEQQRSERWGSHARDNQPEHCDDRAERPRTGRTQQPAVLQASGVVHAPWPGQTRSDHHGPMFPPALDATRERDCEPPI